MLIAAVAVLSFAACSSDDKSSTTSVGTTDGTLAPATRLTTTSDATDVTPASAPGTSDVETVPTTVAPTSSTTTAPVGQTTVAPSGPTTVGPTQPVGDTWSAGLPPDGVWQANLTSQDLIGQGVSPGDAEALSGLYILTFAGGTGGFEFSGADDHYACDLTIARVEGNAFRVTYNLHSGDETDKCEGTTDDVQWRLDPDGLHLHVIRDAAVPYTEHNVAYDAKPYQLISD